MKIKKKFIVFTSGALGARVADVAGRTATAGPVIVDRADGALGTVTGADAARVATGQVVGTLVVGGALGTLTALVRIAEVAVLAVAARLVVAVDAAEGVRAALGDQAGVHAEGVGAGLAQGALVVAAAADCGGGQMWFEG